MPDASSSDSGWLPPEPPGSPPSRFAPPARASEPAPAPPAPDGVEPRRPRFVKAGATRRPPASGLATASTVLGVLGLVLLVFSLGVAAIGSFALCGAGWLLAAIERRRARALDPDMPPPAAAGRLLGMLGVVLSAIAVLVWSLLIASGDSPQDVLERWREQLEQQQREPLPPDPSRDEVEV